jgi:zinc protease
MTERGSSQQINTYKVTRFRDNGKNMQKTALLLSWLVGLSVLNGSCTHAPVHPNPKFPEVTLEGRFEVIPLVGEFQVKRAKLPNGLRLLVIEDRSSPTFAYQTWFNVGSRNEVPGKTGLAHLFEHMMFKGTKNHKDGEFDALLEKAGAEGENAFTSNDHTVYLQEMPKEGFQLITELEADRMVNLIVDDKAFKTEREVVQNERRFRKENSPEGTMYQTLFETAFGSHPYHWPVIGYEEDLSSMSAQDARDFYTRFYSPDRATIVIAGDIDADDALKRIEKMYGALPPRNTSDLPASAEPEQSAQRRVKLPLNVEVEKLWMAFKIPGVDSPDLPVLEAIQGLLTDGNNSRLQRALVDSGIAASVDSGNIPLREPGLFLFDLNLQKGKSLLLAESVLQREIERLKSSPVRAEELQRSSNVIRYRFLQKLSTAMGRAHFVGNAETEHGGVEKALDYQKKILEATPERIQEVARKYFNTARMTVVVAVPKSKS